MTKILIAITFAVISFNSIGQCQVNKDDFTNHVKIDTKLIVFFLDGSTGTNGFGFYSSLLYEDSAFYLTGHYTFRDIKNHTINKPTTVLLKFDNGSIIELLTEDILEPNYPQDDWTQYKFKMEISKKDFEVIANNNLTAFKTEINSEVYTSKILKGMIKKLNLGASCILENI